MNDSNSKANDLVRKAIESIRNQDFEDALSLCEKAIEISPHNEGAWSNKGTALLGLGFADKAVEAFDQAVGIGGKDPQVWSNRAAAFGKIGKLDDALVSIEHALAINSNLPDAWGNKAQILAMSGRMKEAIGCLEKLLEIDPKSMRGILSKALLHSSQNQNEAAIALYDRALELDPDNTSIIFAKALSCMKAGKFEEAHDCYDKILSLAPDHIESLVNKGICLNYLGKHPEALRCFELVVKADDKNPWSWMNLAKAHAANKDIDKAIETIERAIELKPDELSIPLIKADFLYIAQKTDEARSTIVEVLKRSPMSPDAWYALGIIDKNLDKKDKAIEAFKKCLEYSPGGESQIKSLAQQNLSELRK
ncbi:MAG TPA: tetratricopeptide repeat protein [bacterium]